MNAKIETAAPTSISQPLIERVVGEVFAALRAAELAVADLWRRDQSPCADPRAFNSIEGLDERTLKDIGAPHWLVARAAARREAQHLRWVEFDAR